MNPHKMNFTSKKGNYQMSNSISFHPEKNFVSTWKKKRKKSSIFGIKFQSIKISSTKKGILMKRSKHIHKKETRKAIQFKIILVRK